MDLIDLKDAYKIYNEGYENEVRALSGVSLQVQRGEFLSIVGASGSGKSTLMNILGCLDIPTYGTYHLDGQDVGELTDRQLSKIRNKEVGFVFQGFHLIQALNAYENVELPLIYQGISGIKRREMVMEALERVKLTDRAHHKPSEMSGGQQQRVAIARAIAPRPALIFADEPTGNLDAATGQGIIELLFARGTETGATLVIITHDPALADRCERIVTLADGRIASDTGAK